jgi:N-carbamoyl-L-amino-acid hydrolase
MDCDLLACFTNAAAELNIPYIQMASGAGHDAAVFAAAGVPTAMVFVRNQNGSHNPDESMCMDDFELAVRVIARAVADLS